MRICFLIMLFNLSFLKSYGQRQVKVWLDKYAWETTSIEDAVLYRVGKKNRNEQWEGKITDFSKEGSKIMEGNMRRGKESGLFEYYHVNGQVSERGRYRKGQKIDTWEAWYSNGQIREIRYGYSIKSFWDSTGVQLIKDGTGVWYSVYSSGELQTIGQYSNGKNDGEWLYYREDKRLEQKESYREGNLIEGQYFDESGEVVAYNNFFVERLPIFPNGNTGLMQFLSQHIQYPVEAYQRKISGTVFIGLLIAVSVTRSALRLSWKKINWYLFRRMKAYYTP